MYKIRKKFSFEMAHLLTSSYSTECQRIHGHSYTLEVIIQANSVNADDMVIDFKKLKEIVDHAIIDKYDHALLVSNQDPIHKKLLEIGLVFQECWYNPTAENMVKDFNLSLFAKLKFQIPSMKRLTIRLHETDSGWVEFTQGD